MVTLLQCLQLKQGRLDFFFNFLKSFSIIKFIVNPFPIIISKINAANFDKSI